MRDSEYATVYEMKLDFVNRSFYEIGLIEAYGEVHTRSSVFFIQFHFFLDAVYHLDRVGSGLLCMPMFIELAPLYREIVRLSSIRLRHGPHP